MTRLDRRTQALLRVAAAAGRTSRTRCSARWRCCRARRARVAAPLGRTRRPRRRPGERQLPLSARAPGGGDLLHDPAASRSYAARRAASRAAQLLHRRSSASHWAAAGRLQMHSQPRSKRPARRRSAFGLAEALAHLERALRLWDAVPGAAELAGVDLAGLCSWAAELASQAGGGAGGRAGKESDRSDRRRDPLGAARLYERLGRYLHESGRTDAALSAFERGRVRAGTATSARRAEALCARPRDDARLALRRVARDLRAGARLAPAVEARAVELRALLTSAGTSPTLAAPRRASGTSGRRSSSPRRAAIHWRFSMRTSRSPTC